jgi:hypothetical protein
VFLIDGNAQPMDEDGIARYVREQNIGLVGIGAMTLMIAKAYRMADAVRAAGVPVVMGRAHPTIVEVRYAIAVPLVCHRGWG